MNKEQLTEQVMKQVEDQWEQLVAFNDDLADHPEISGEEFRSSARIAELLTKKGFQVEKPFAGYETAFRAIYGDNSHKRKVAILTEYDALPEIGHACGHCTSASISLLAGISLSKVQDALDADIHLIGTPAEETDGAKCTMVDDGIFDSYDMAIMLHLMNYNAIHMDTLALSAFKVQFHGKNAHAAAEPWNGANALNGAQLMLHAVDMLRQHVKPNVRMHAIYTNGGAAPNIVPDEAEIEIYVRADSREYLNEVIPKVEDCAKGAAIATQTTYTWSPRRCSYDNMKCNATGLKVLREIYGELGLEIKDTVESSGSSDVGNVSQVCPTFQPMLQICNAPIHSRDFASAVKTPVGHQAISTGAKVLALQIIRIFTDDSLLQAMKDDFKK